MPPSDLCEQDPCQLSMCLKLPMTKCVTSALCMPVFFDETGNVLNCTGKKIKELATEHLLYICCVGVYVLQKEISEIVATD